MAAVVCEPLVLINPPGRRLGEHNPIMSGRVADWADDTRIAEDFAGPLSIKSVFRGAGVRRTPRVSRSSD